MEEVTGKTYNKKMKRKKKNCNVMFGNAPWSRTVLGRTGLLTNLMQGLMSPLELLTTERAAQSHSPHLTTEH